MCEPNVQTKQLMRNLLKQSSIFILDQKCDSKIVGNGVR